MGRHRQIATIQRDQQALSLRASGATFLEIAKAIGVGSPAAAKYAVGRALHDGVAGDFDELRATEGAELTNIRRKLWAIANKQHIAYASGTGRIITDPVTGEPLTDDAPVIAALSQLTRLSDRFSRLLGLDAPKRSDITLSQIPLQVFDSEIERLKAELTRQGVESLDEPSQFKTISGHAEDPDDDDNADSDASEGE